MNRTIRNLAFFGGGLVLLSFTVFVVNQTAQMVQLASSLHPSAGRVALIGLLGAYVVLIGVPLIKLARLPRPLVPPATPDGPEYQAHLDRLRQRLKLNRRLGGLELADEASIRKGIGELDDEALGIVKATATRVFLSTAVSQSGRLDTLMVLAMQTRMVWQIAHLYYQRPSIRDLVHLYSNVAGTAFVAGELQDIDLSEQVEPVFSAVVGSLGGAVPGLQLATSILANSILSGAADAFLTLRVGMIARRSCGTLVRETPGTMRRKATSEAAEQLGAIVAEGSSRITRALWRNSRDKAGDVAKEAYSKVVTVLDRIKKRGQADVTA